MLLAFVNFLIYAEPMVFLRRQFYVDFYDLEAGLGLLNINKTRQQEQSEMSWRHD